MSCTEFRNIAKKYKNIKPQFQNKTFLLKGEYFLRSWLAKLVVGKPNMDNLARFSRLFKFSLPDNRSKSIDYGLKRAKGTRDDDVYRQDNRII